MTKLDEATAVGGLAPECDIEGSPYTTERLARWLDAQLSRHKEQEDGVAAQRLRCQAAEIERQRKVIATVNARCDHLGMSLRDIKAERDLFRSLLNEWNEGEYSGGDFLRRVKLALHKGQPRVSLASLRGIAKRGA